MKIWILPALLALYWLPQLAFDRGEWDGAKYDIHLFESADKRAMAVVTPDPFSSDDEEGVRAWRAEVHVRVGGTSVSEELRFRTARIEKETLVFVETAWGREVHIFEACPDLGSGKIERRRWLARPDGLEELNPNR